MEVNDMKKMREALEAVKRVGYPHNFQREAYHIRSYCEEITAAIRKCMEALSAPARNCEVGTPEERLHRYHNLCREISDRYDRIGERAPLLAFPTAFEWEDRPLQSRSWRHTGARLRRRRGRSARRWKRTARE